MGAMFEKEKHHFVRTHRVNQDFLLLLLSVANQPTYHACRANEPPEEVRGAYLHISPLFDCDFNF